MTTREIMTAEEAAEFLDVCRETLSRYVKERGMPFLQYRPGGHKKFMLAHICLWLANAKIISLFDPSCAEGERVYFLKCADHVKIGTSANLKRRIAQLSTVVPIKPELLGVLRGGRSLERRIHDAFSHLRKHGEWFTASPGLMFFCDHVLAQP